MRRVAPSLRHTIARIIRIYICVIAIISTTRANDFFPLSLSLPNILRAVFLSFTVRLLSLYVQLSSIQSDCQFLSPDMLYVRSLLIPVRLRWCGNTCTCITTEREQSLNQNASNYR